jgi:hypothetical protein
MLIVAVPMAEQVHQGAGQQNQVWNGGEYVAGMVPKQIRADRRDPDRRSQPNLGT